ncbi:MAG: tRNA (adenosine(37)-N6)-dimethylallyltransferase MiaA [Actinomycetota bacterium]|nr:tRNA (adenosine(37)-N6)-dimethylallyltransferase MiaA [Actinomycetota bacterium]
MEAPPEVAALALVGTTASGKSDVALAVARVRPWVEIVSVDSMSVYRGMDVATAKPSEPVRRAVPHHLVDVADPSEEFTVADYQRLARRALVSIAARRHLALLVGGTGLYLRSVVDGLALPGRWPEVASRLEHEADLPGGLVRLYQRLEVADPLAASRIGPGNRRRIVRALEVTLGSGRPFSSFGPGLESYRPVGTAMLGIPFDPELVDRRIEDRMRRWMDEGLVEEVRRLAGGEGGLSRTARQALGYREVLAHLERGVALEECVDEAIRRTRALARRQWSWFRRDPRIEWLVPGEDAVERVGEVLDRCRLAGQGTGRAG